MADIMKNFNGFGSILKQGIAFLPFFGGIVPNSTTVDMSNTLYVNALVGRLNVSTLECWGFLPGFADSSQPGTVGNKILQLGNVANASYTEFPTGFSTDSGLHNAPNKQIVVLLSGSVNINFPESVMENFTIAAPGIVIAMDVEGTSGIGHRSVWESGSKVLQIPFSDDYEGKYHVYGEGICPS